MTALDCEGHTQSERLLVIVPDQSNCAIIIVVEFLNGECYDKIITSCRIYIRGLASVWDFWPIVRLDH